MRNPILSIVIPVYNREKEIKVLLDSILMQDFQDYEIIVSDDCSKDNTVEILRGYKKKFGSKINVIVNRKNGGPGFARSMALSWVKGEYIVFLDSDVNLVGKDWLKSMLHWYNKLDNGRLAGIEARQIFPSKSNFLARSIYFIPGLAGNTDQFKDKGKYPFAARFASTTASLWKRDVVLCLGGFDATLRTGEDSLLSYNAKKQNYNFYIVPVDVIQTPRETISGFLKQQYWYGVGGGILLRKYKDWLGAKKYIVYLVFIAPIFLLMFYYYPITMLILLVPFIMYIRNAAYAAKTTKNVMFFFSLLILQYVKHVANLLGVLNGQLLGRRLFVRK